MGRENDKVIREFPILWLQLASCTGCSVSLLNTASPTIRNLLIEPVIPGVHVNLIYHTTLMAGAGEPVLKVLEDAAQSGGYVLVAEGAVPTATEAIYGAIGERGTQPVTMAQRLEELASNALAILCVGTCAAFGGIPAAKPNPTACVCVGEYLASRGIKKPIINIPGCPPHPDWLAGTIASIILGGLPRAEELDDLGRPRAFYGKLIHENCPRRASFDEGKFAHRPGDEGCLYEMGCKGPLTYADCPTRRWNSAVNWVIGAGAPCNGCTQPEFPDGTSPFYQKLKGVPVPSMGECWQREATP